MRSKAAGWPSCPQKGRSSPSPPGRYSGAPNFAVLKHGHAGEGMRVDRVGRTSEIIESAHVTLGICTQPDVLAGLADTPQFRGQGLLGRILYAVPASLLGYRDASPELVPAHVAQTYADTLSHLITRLHAVSEPISLAFTDAATAAVQELLRETEPRYRPGNDLAHMPDWGGKFPGAVVRIAGLLHLAHHPHGTWNHPITTDTFACARQVGDYFLTHAQAAYDLIGADPDLADARALRDWIARTGIHRFTARDAVQALRPRFRKVADTEPGLRVLETHGWIRRLPSAPRASAAGRAPQRSTRPTRSPQRRTDHDRRPPLHSVTSPGGSRPPAPLHACTQCTEIN
ncbi:YfjI family protein [Actinomadura madurae]|uniref:DUF3987 domain-containing protein n=1 Tax=Actinomadura madurae TaxID=1993 RepID=UPI0020D237FA|nr:DUF3987 domain-containing protein [Actinomadura madurae]MCP9971418.1 YfjI family protein [Actinomadura madurae]